MDTRVIKFCLFLSVLIFFLTACVSKKDIIYLNDRVNELYQQSKRNEKKFGKLLEELEKKVELNESLQQEIKKSLHDDQESIRLQVAQVEADLIEIKDSVRELTGKVEENSHLLKRTTGEGSIKVGAMGTKMRELSAVVDELELRIEKIESSLGFEPPVDKKTAGMEKDLPVTKTPQRYIARPQKKKPTESQVYGRALKYYRDERYEEAKSGFDHFLSSFPKSNLADNAHFWIGECYRALKKYEEAILAYQKVINDYPKGNKVPSAMLQQALTFEKINDQTTARLVLKKLVANFPRSKEAKIARERLK